MKAAGAGHEAPQAAARVEFTVEFSRGPRGKRQLRAAAVRETVATEARPAPAPPPTAERAKVAAAPCVPEAKHLPRQAMTGRTVTGQVHAPAPERVAPVPRPTSPPAPPRATATPAATPVPRVPKITQLLVLGHYFERLVREGAVKDYSEIARRTGLTRARVTQICNLTLLAPGIQEEILYLPPSVQGGETVHERTLRAVVAELDWSGQRLLLSGDAQPTSSSPRR